MCSNDESSCGQVFFDRVDDNDEHMVTNRVYSLVVGDTMLFGGNVVNSLRGKMNLF